MINLPAICKNCGTIFGSGFAVENSTVTMVGSEAGPCPKCGSQGRIPDGTYKIIENVIEVLSAPQRTVDELIKLSATLENANNDNYSEDEIKRKIEQDVPAMSSVMDLLPKTREERRADIHLLIKSILAVLSFVIPLMSNNDSNTQVNIRPEQVINNVYQIEKQHIHGGSNLNEEADIIERKIEPVRVNKVGRNEPCPCGSGLKYKKCCGW